MTNMTVQEATYLFDDFYTESDISTKYREAWKTIKKVYFIADTLLKEYDAVYDIGVTNPVRYPDVLKEWLEKVRSYNKARTNP